ncbi:MAG: M67 family metallopeptidase [Solirubrobacterales bacterium]
MLDEMIEHAREDAPNECCGLIGGIPEEAQSIHRAVNAEASPFRYSIAPREQLQLMNQIEGDGQQIAGIYHSHTRTPAYPSQTDINLASGWPDAIYFIVSLEHSDTPVVKAFRIEGSKVEDVAVRTS